MIVSKTKAQRLLRRELDGRGFGRRSYYVLSEDGTKNLGGPYDKAGAERRLRQVEYYKRRKKR